MAQSGSPLPKITSGVPLALTPYASGLQLPEKTRYGSRFHSTLHVASLMAIIGPWTAPLSCTPTYRVVTPPGGLAITGLAKSIPVPSDTRHCTAPVSELTLIILPLTAVPIHRWVPTTLGVACSGTPSASDQTMAPLAVLIASRSPFSLAT